MVVSVLIPSILTIFLPPICRASYPLALIWRALIGRSSVHPSQRLWMTLCTVVLCAGFFESATFPAVFHFFPIWVPLKEKTFLIPAIVSGACVML